MKHEQIISQLQKKIASYKERFGNYVFVAPAVVVLLFSMTFCGSSKDEQVVEAQSKVDKTIIDSRLSTEVNTEIKVTPELGNQADLTQEKIEKEKKKIINKKESPQKGLSTEKSALSSLLSKKNGLIMTTGFEPESTTGKESFAKVLTSKAEQFTNGVSLEKAFKLYNSNRGAYSETELMAMVKAASDDEVIQLTKLVNNYSRSYYVKVLQIFPGHGKALVESGGQDYFLYGNLEGVVDGERFYRKAVDGKPESYETILGASRTVKTLMAMSKVDVFVLEEKKLRMQAAIERRKKENLAFMEKDFSQVKLVSFDEALIHPSFKSIGLPEADVIAYPVKDELETASEYEGRKKTWEQSMTKVCDKFLSPKKVSCNETFFMKVPIPIKLLHIASYKNQSILDIVFDSNQMKNRFFKGFLYEGGINIMGVMAPLKSASCDGWYWSFAFSMSLKQAKQLRDKLGKVSVTQNFSRKLAEIAYAEALVECSIAPKKDDYRRKVNLYNTTIIRALYFTPKSEGNAK